MTTDAQVLVFMRTNDHLIRYRPEITSANRHFTLIFLLAYIQLHGGACLYEEDPKRATRRVMIG